MIYALICLSGTALIAVSAAFFGYRWHQTRQNPPHKDADLNRIVREFAADRLSHTKVG